MPKSKPKPPTQTTAKAPGRTAIHRVTIDLPEPVARRLEAIVKATGHNQSTVVRIAITQMHDWIQVTKTEID